MSQPVEIFDRVGSFVHQIPLDPARPEIIRIAYGDTISFEGSAPDETVNGEASVEITCTTSASAYSTLALDNPSACVNYILLRHDLEFNPVFSESNPSQGATAWQSYSVRVRPLNQAGQKALKEGDTGVIAWEDPWTDNLVSSNIVLIPDRTDHTTLDGPRRTFAS